MPLHVSINYNEAGPSSAFWNWGVQNFFLTGEAVRSPKNIIISSLSLSKSRGSVDPPDPPPTRALLGGSKVARYIMYLIFFVLLMERMLQNLPYFIYKKRYAVFFFNLSNFEFYLINPQVYVDIYMGFLINKIWPILMCFSRRLNWAKSFYFFWRFLETFL